MDKRTDCQHIIGFMELARINDAPSGVLLVGTLDIQKHFGEDSGDTRFTFCPLCGVRING